MCDVHGDALLLCNTKGSYGFKTGHDALRDLGISVFWGMLTSAIAASALALCELQFLAKFGLSFLLIILWAYSWAVLFLMPLLATIGPEPLTAGVASSSLPEAQGIALADAPPDEIRQTV